MFEIALAAVFVTMAIMTLGGRNSLTPNTSHHSLGDLYVSTIGDGSDLPCPWCEAPTSAGDQHCPSCGHRFG